MNNLIEKVAELRELATTDIPGKYTSDCPEYDYMVGVLNTAPKLLDALSKIQAGDANRFDLLLNGYGGWMESLLTEEDKNMLRRYADLARQMEDDYAT